MKNVNVKEKRALIPATKFKPKKKGIAARIKTRISEAGNDIMQGAMKGAIKGAIKGALAGGLEEAKKVVASVGKNRQLKKAAKEKSAKAESGSEEE